MGAGLLRPNPTADKVRDLDTHLILQQPERPQSQDGGAHASITVVGKCRTQGSVMTRAICEALSKCAGASSKPGRGPKSSSSAMPPASPLDARRMHAADEVRVKA
jgi:hypothetical protein